MAQRKVLRIPDKKTFVSAAASMIVDQAAQCIQARGSFFLVLSGGGTPRPVYEALAEPEYAECMDWGRTRVFFGDERAVPPDHVHSNYRMASEALLSKVPLLERNVFRIKGEMGAEAAAAHYHEAIKTSGVPMENGIPTFDLVVLGMGPDGHTASLFPDHASGNQHQGWTHAVPEPGLDPQVPRTTLTLPVLNKARKAIFLVAQQGKESALERVLLENDTKMPAARVEAGEVIWLIDASR